MRRDQFLVVLGILVGICSCIAAWLTVPQVQRRVDQILGSEAATRIPTSQARVMVPAETPIPFTSTLVEPTLTPDCSLTTE